MMASEIKVGKALSVRGRQKSGGFPWGNLIFAWPSRSPTVLHRHHTFGNQLSYGKQKPA